MNLTPQTKRILIAILFGTISGIILSILFVNWLWLPLMIGVSFIFSFFCKEATDIPENEEKKFYDQ